MKTTLKVEKPDAIEMTLAITMTLADWKAFKDQLSQSYPSWKFSGAIRVMIEKAHAHFEPNEATE